MPEILTNVHELCESPVHVSKAQVADVSHYDVAQSTTAEFHGVGRETIKELQDVHQNFGSIHETLGGK